MLPYLTRRSVVGVNSGTESGITRADLNLLSTSADMAAVIPEAGQDCLSASRGEPQANAGRRKMRMNVFIVYTSCRGADSDGRCVRSRWLDTFLCF